MRLDDGQRLRLPNCIVISAGIIKARAHDWLHINFRFDVDAALDIEMVLDHLRSAAAKHFGEQTLAENTAPTQSKLPLSQTSGWREAQVVIVDFSPNTTSIEIRATVPAQEQALRKERLFREIVPYLRRQKAQAG